MLRKIRQTLELIRFSHTVFALPFALASMLVAAGGLPDTRTILLILGCMVTARTSAMAFNRYVDANIDARNPRTADRHIPTGILSRSYVFILALVSGSLFIGLAYFLNGLTFVLSPVVLAVVWFYSYTKRLTHWTQLFLGLALGLSPVGAWIAVTGKLAWPPMFLGAAVAFWVAGFDIFYATQDHEFDKTHGIRSLVARFGIPRALSIAKIFHGLTVLFLLSFAAYIPSPQIYLVGCAIVTATLIYEHSLVKPDDLSRVNRAFFTLNGWIGMVFFAGTAIAVFM